MPVWIKILLGVIIYLLMIIITSIIYIRDKSMGFDTSDDTDIFMIGFISCVWVGTLPVLIIIHVFNKIGHIGKNIAQRLDSKNNL